MVALTYALLKCFDQLHSIFPKKENVTAWHGTISHHCSIVLFKKNTTSNIETEQISEIPNAPEFPCFTFKRLVEYKILWIYRKEETNHTWKITLLDNKQQLCPLKKTRNCPFLKENPIIFHLPTNVFQGSSFSTRHEDTTSVGRPLSMVICQEETSRVANWATWRRQVGKTPTDGRWQHEPQGSNYDKYLSSQICFFVHSITNDFRILARWMCV